MSCAHVRALRWDNEKLIVERRGGLVFVTLAPPSPRLPVKLYRRDTQSGVNFEIVLAKCFEGHCQKLTSGRTRMTMHIAGAM